MKFNRKHTYYTLSDTTKDVLIGGDPYLQGQTEVFYTREDARMGRNAYIVECLQGLEDGESIDEWKVELQLGVKVVKIRY